jgi:hypothetical protein
LIESLTFANQLIPRPAPSAEEKFMSGDKDQGLFLRWGHEVAIGIGLLAMIGSVALIIIAAAKEGDVRAASMDALKILAVGAVVVYGVLRLRKRSERAHRPDWMGSTTQWRDEIKTKITKED